VKKFVLGAVAALLLVAPAADAKAFRGTVVKKGNRSVVVAPSSGSLKTVRTARHFGLGTKLRVNGHRITRLGHASRAKKPAASAPAPDQEIAASDDWKARLEASRRRMQLL